MRKRVQGVIYEVRCTIERRSSPQSPVTCMFYMFIHEPPPPNILLPRNNSKENRGPSLQKWHCEYQLENSRKLLQLGSLIQSTIQNFVPLERQERKKPGTQIRAPGGGGAAEGRSSMFGGRCLPAAGTLTELLVSEPQNRLAEVGAQHWDPRALYIVVDRRVSDLLSQSGEQGLMDIKTLGGRRSALNIHRKLSVSKSQPFIPPSCFNETPMYPSLLFLQRVPITTISREPRRLNHLAIPRTPR